MIIKSTRENKLNDTQSYDTQSDDTQYDDTQSDDNSEDDTQSFLDEFESLSKNSINELKIKNDDIKIPINIELDSIKFNNAISNMTISNIGESNNYNEFIKLNNQMESQYDHMITKMKVFDIDSYDRLHFNFKKKKFDIDICNKLTKLSQKIRIMDKKNSSYKNCFDSVNISIILLSTVLTLLESFKAEFDDTFSELTKKFLRLSPILFSSIITCSAGILKFKKYQEKIELLTKIKEKSIVMITKLKKLKENISYCESINKLEILIKYYNKDLYEQYATIIQDISQCISNKDYKYLSPIFEVDSKIHILNSKRSFFFKNYDYPKNQIDADFIKKKCVYEKKNCCL